MRNDYMQALKAFKTLETSAIAFSEGDPSIKVMCYREATESALSKATNADVVRMTEFLRQDTALDETKIPLIMQSYHCIEKTLELFAASASKHSASGNITEEQAWGAYLTIVLGCMSDDTSALARQEVFGKPWVLH